MTLTLQTASPSCCAVVERGCSHLIGTLLPSFLSFSLVPLVFSQERPGQGFSGEVALGRIGAMAAWG